MVRDEYLFAAGALGLAAFAGMATGDDDTSDDPDNGGDDPTDPSGPGPIGGGSGYPDTVTEAEADYVVESDAALESALNGASSGDIVFLADDVYGVNFRVPSGVTLASGRGTNDYTATLSSPRDTATPAIKADSGARVTGLIQAGGETGYRHHPDRGGFWVAGVGISTGGNARVDNCEVYGHERGVVLNGPNSVVEHSHVHHCLQGGTGYGVRANGDGSIIRYCELDYNRHSVATAGSVGYEAHDNWCGPNHVSHVFDHHNGGTDTHIHHNTVEQYLGVGSLPSASGGSEDTRHANSPLATVIIRGVPSGNTRIHHNWTHHPDGPFPGGTDACIGESPWHRPAITQMEVSRSCTGYHNMSVYSNHYGSSTPSDPDIGARGTRR